VADLNFTEYERTLAGKNAAINIGTDIAMLGLGSAGSAVSTTVIKTILAAISAGVAGTRVSIESGAAARATRGNICSFSESSMVLESDLVEIVEPDCVDDQIPAG
jgi:hypothetical protein